MVPLRINGETNRLGPPKGWDEAAQGKCIDLSIRVKDGMCQSSWEPTPRELELLNAGKPVILSVVGGQPPVWLSVEEE